MPPPATPGAGPSSPPSSPGGQSGSAAAAAVVAVAVVALGVAAAAAAWLPAGRRRPSTPAGEWSSWTPPRGSRTTTQQLGNRRPGMLRKLYKKHRKSGIFLSYCLFQLFL